MEKKRETTVLFRVFGLGPGDLVRKLIRGITRDTIWVIGVTNLVTKSP